MKYKLVAVDKISKEAFVFNALKTILIENYFNTQYNYNVFNLLLNKIEPQIVAKCFGDFYSNKEGMQNEATNIKVRERIFNVLSKALIHNTLLDEKPIFMQTFIQNLLDAEFEKQAFINFIKSIDNEIITTSKKTNVDTDSHTLMLRTILGQMTETSNFHNAYKAILSIVEVISPNSDYLDKIKLLEKNEDIHFLDKYALEFVTSYLENLDLNREIEEMGINLL